MRGIIAVFVEVADAHKMLLQISAYEVRVGSIFRSPGSLSPQSLEILQVVLEVHAEVVFVLMSNVQARLEFGFTLVVVLEVFL